MDHKKMDIIIVYIFILIVTLVFVSISIMVFMCSKQHLELSMTIDLKDVYRSTERGKIEKINKMKINLSTGIKNNFDINKLKNTITTTLHNEFGGMCLVKNFNIMVAENIPNNNIIYKIIKEDACFEKITVITNKLLSKKVKKHECKITGIKMYGNDFTIKYVKNR